MTSKWNHINAFIKEKGKASRDKIRKLDVKKDDDQKEILEAQIVKPVRSFDLEIESFLDYLKGTLFTPYGIIKNDQSSRFFFYAMLSFVLYLITLFFIGMLDKAYSWQEGISHMMAGGAFIIVTVLFTFCIQLLSINQMNTIYKVFVDTMSYFALVIVISVVQIILLLIGSSYNHALEVICFLIIMSIPIRLFSFYNEKHKFDVDIFKLNIIFIILIVVYMTLTKEVPWLWFFREI